MEDTARMGTNMFPTSMESSYGSTGPQLSGMPSMALEGNPSISQVPAAGVDDQRELGWNRIHSGDHAAQHWSGGNADPDIGYDAMQQSRKRKFTCERSPSPSGRGLNSNVEYDTLAARSKRGRHPDSSTGNIPEEYNDRMFRRLREEISASRDPKQREERIAAVIQEMAELSPDLFRNFMANNADSLSKVLSKEQEEPEKHVFSKQPGFSIPERGVSSHPSASSASLQRPSQQEQRKWGVQQRSVGQEPGMVAGEEQPKWRRGSNPQGSMGRIPGPASEMLGSVPQFVARMSAPMHPTWPHSRAAASDRSQAFGAQPPEHGFDSVLPLNQNLPSDSRQSDWSHFHPGAPEERGVRPEMSRNVNASSATATEAADITSASYKTKEQSLVSLQQRLILVKKNLLKRLQEMKNNESYAKDPVIMELKESQRQLQSQITALEMKKKEEFLKSSELSFHDSGELCCIKCGIVCSKLTDFLEHLSTKMHEETQSSRPWLEEAQKKYNLDNHCSSTNSHSLKGEEFLLFTRAFYCSLCKEMCADASIAEAHVKSMEHKKLYMNYLSQNATYALHYMKECSALKQKTTAAEIKDDKRGGDQQKMQDSRVRTEGRAGSGSNNDRPMASRNEPGRATSARDGNRNSRDGGRLDHNKVEPRGPSGGRNLRGQSDQNRGLSRDGASNRSSGSSQGRSDPNRPRDRSKDRSKGSSRGRSPGQEGKSGTESKQHGSTLISQKEKGSNGQEKNADKKNQGRKDGHEDKRDAESAGPSRKEKEDQRENKKDAERGLENRTNPEKEKLASGRKEVEQKDKKDAKCDQQLKGRKDGNAESEKSSSEKIEDEDKNKKDPGKQDARPENIKKPELGKPTYSKSSKPTSKSPNLKKSSEYTSKVQGEKQKSPIATPVTPMSVSLSAIEMLMLEVGGDNFADDDLEGTGCIDSGDEYF